jgi:glycosyltransferase involved in cell wall biosynthesis
MQIKILIINNGLAGGGIEKASTAFANYLAEQNIEVHVLALYKSNPFFELDSRIKFIEPDFSRNNLSTVQYIFKMMFYVRKNVEKIKPNTILAYGEWTNPYVLIALNLQKFPVYVSDRMNPLAKLPFISRILKRFLYKKTKGIIAQTNFAKQILYQETKSQNIIVIPNALTPIQGELVKKKNRIISVGRLTSEKGHKYLIEAFSKIENLDWDLCIVGDGIERKALEYLAVELKISNRVIFHGHLKDFTKLMLESKIFVLPSIKEGFPNALIEAMSVPLACISTDFLGNQNEIITNEFNGLIVPTCNANKMGQAIQYLIDNPSICGELSKEAFKVRDELLFEKIATQYLNFITAHDDKFKKEFK